MSNPIYKVNEDRYPHADDVFERQTAEAGFASGWGMHHKPVPKYYFDSHIHYRGPDDFSMPERIRSSMAVWEAHEAARMMVIINICGEKQGSAVPEYADTEWFPWFTTECAKGLMGDLSEGGRCFWSAWIDHREPNPRLVRAAAEAGALGIKLHNAPVIETNAPYDIWLSDEWREVFTAIGERALPVLFHVTQRLPGSAYTGGGKNTYWSKGWKNGVTYGNEDLLQTFLTCCRRHPDITFIGAHQLHIGWERLDGLFTEIPNLYVDTTVGCTLREYDDFYPNDKEYLRGVFIKWADRILFGTDCIWGGDGADIGYATLRQHMHFITSLDLPGDVLDKICRINMERVYHVKPL